MVLKILFLILLPRQRNKVSRAQHRHLARNKWDGHLVAWTWMTSDDWPRYES